MYLNQKSGLIVANSDKLNNLSKLYNFITRLVLVSFLNSSALAWAVPLPEEIQNQYRLLLSRAQTKGEAIDLVSSFRALSEVETSVELETFYRDLIEIEASFLDPGVAPDLARGELMAYCYECRSARIPIKNDADYGSRNKYSEEDTRNKSIEKVANILIAGQSWIVMAGLGVAGVAAFMGATGAVVVACQSGSWQAPNGRSNLYLSQIWLTSGVGLGTAAASATCCSLTYPLKELVKYFYNSINRRAVRRLFRISSAQSHRDKIERSKQLLLIRYGGSVPSLAEILDYLAGSLEEN